MMSAAEVVELLERVSAIWAALLVDATVKSAVLVAGAAVFCAAWRRATAEVRHLAWFLAILGCGLAPVLSIFLASHQAGVIPRPAAERPLVQATPGAVEAESGVAEQARRSWGSKAGGIGAIASQAGSVRSQGHIGRNGEPVSVEPEGNRSLGLPIGRGFGARAEWTFWCSAVWLVGVAAVGGWFLCGIMAARGLARRARAADEPRILAMFDSLTAMGRLGLGRVRLLVSDGASMPFTFGLIRPVIVLPEQACAWPGERLRLVLRHELAHVRRGDSATQCVAGVIRVVLWFNPLVWYASARLRSAQEEATDDEVLAEGAKASDYAEALLFCARNLQLSRAILPVVGRSRLGERLRAILDPSRGRRRTTWRSKAMYGVAGTLVAVPLFFVRATVEGEEPRRDKDRSVAARVSDARQENDASGKQVDRPGRVGPGAEPQNEVGLKAAEMPPVVVRTVPAAGELEADPGLREIRVTFSKPMDTRSWSWGQVSEESFPKTTGRARWDAGRRTSVLPVSLRPGRTYAIWLNQPPQDYFQDEEGQPAVKYLLVFRTRGE